MYMAYCASCHGADGKGNGPAAAALKTPATDLTQIAAKNGGTFPDAHIMQIIKGDSMTAAHGNKDMPVWGPVFLQMADDTAQVQCGFATDSASSNADSQLDEIPGSQSSRSSVSAARVAWFPRMTKSCFRVL